MPPTAAIRSLKWAGFQKIEPLSALNISLLESLESTSQITPGIDNILHSRQGQSGDDSGPTRGFPVTSNVETTMGPPDPHGNSPIPGLNRSLFVVVIVSGVFILGLALFIPIYCWRRHKRNQRRAQNTPSRELDLELAGLGNQGPPEQNYDAPRPDSTTLPMQGMLMQLPARTLPIIEGTMGSSLEDMLNRFNNGSGSVSHHRRLESEDSERSRITWGNDIGMAISTTPPTWDGPSNYHDSSSRLRSSLCLASPALAMLRSRTIASFNSNPVGGLRSPTISYFISNSREALQPSTTASSTANSPRISEAAKGKEPQRNSKEISQSSSTSSKLRKKTQSKPEKVATQIAIAHSPISTFGGFGRVSAGSMSNWDSWFKDTSDEDEEAEPVMKQNKRKT